MIVALNKLEKDLRIFIADICFDIAFRQHRRIDEIEEFLNDFTD